MTSVKGYLGHSLAAAGALEAVVSTLTLMHQIIPPTVGTTVIDPEIDADVVIGEPRPARVANVLSNSFGFGGHNGCLAIGEFR